MIILSPEPTLFSFSCIIFFLVTHTFFHKVGGALIHSRNESIPALIVFGDSIVDPGNNNYLSTVVKCNFQPYGRDFLGGKPTGRFCNGRIPTDLLAEELGIKELLPAFLDPTLQLNELLTGVSFASSGSGYDPLTSTASNVISLPLQLELFKKYLKKINSAFGRDKTATILKKGLYVVCTGSDDIAITYFTLRKPHYDLESYADLLVNSALSFIQQLYELGIRKVGVLSLPPIGCVPSQRTLRGGLSRECSAESNQIALLFNSKFSSKLNSLSEKLPEANFVYFDVYNPLLHIIQNPAQYGFEVANKGCCGTGVIEVAVLCTPLSDSHTCTDASKYVFWDSFHPTERAYEILTAQVSKNIIQLML